MRHVTALSFGGGVQTVALAILAARREIARPDVILFADTTRERVATYEYVAKFQRWLSRYRLSVTQCRAEVSLTEALEAGKPVIPMYGDGMGQLPRICTERWKIRVIRSALRERGATSATVMLGISLDEIHRMRDSDVQWAENVYPLIDARLTRRDCERIIQRYGLELPPKSACDVCPHRTPTGWAQLKRDDPKAFAYAVETEERFPGLYLSDRRKPLPVVAAEAETVGDLFDEQSCSSGHCFA